MVQEVVRCKDKIWGVEVIFGPRWCPNAKSCQTFYPDQRCANWLRTCAISGKVVVYNKKCDVPRDSV